MNVGESDKSSNHSNNKGRFSKHVRGALNARLFRAVYPIVLGCVLIILLFATHETLVKPLLATNQDRRVVVVNRDELWMPKGEGHALIRRMHGVRTYLEWGSGGSTLNIAPMALKRAVSIEHDGKWCEKVRTKLKDLAVEYNCIPCRRTDRHDGRYTDFKPYVDRIDTLGEQEWDFVFIDGRARVACAVKALAYIAPHSVVTIHDFQRTRNEYSAILFFYDITEKVHVPGQPGIAFLRRKPRFHSFQGNASAVQAIVDTGAEMFKLQQGAKPPPVFDNIFPPLTPNQ